MKKLHVNFLEAHHRHRPAKRRKRFFVVLAAVVATVLIVGGVMVIKRQPSVKPVVQLLSKARPEQLGLIGTVLGLSRPFTVLVVMQNSTELRPTGGFIGTVGLARISHGRVEQFWTDDVYHFDAWAWDHLVPEAPPAPLAKYLRVHDRGLRDANWDPDFPTSAQEIITRFKEREGSLPVEERAESVDAVVAVTPALVSRLLGSVGPITLGDITFTQENFVTVLQDFVEREYHDRGFVDRERKDVIEQLARELLLRITKNGALALGHLAPIAEAAISTKDILLYAVDPSLMRWISDHHASGSLPLPAGDVLGFFDANLASLKTDSVMERSLHYELHGSTARVTMRYTNHGTFTWKTTRYRTYARVYAPAGSRLISVTGSLQDDRLTNPKGLPGSPDVTEEHGLAVFGGFTSVEPGQTRELSFTYELPDTVLSRNPYTLTVVKQPGTGSVPLTLDFEFERMVKSAQPAGDNKNETGYHWSGRLDHDYNFSIEF